MDTASAPHTHPESSRLEQSLPSTSSTPAPHATFQREGALPPVTQSQQPLATLLLPADRSHQQQQPPLHFQQTQHQGQSGLTGLPGTSQPAQTAPRSAQQQAVLNAQPIPVQHSIVQPVQQLQQQPQVSAAPRPTQSQQPAPIDAMPTAVQKERDNFGLVLPLSRIKKLIKQEGTVKAISAEASYAVARATEMLVESLAVRAAAHMRSGSRSVMIYKDVATSVKEWAAADFLADIVPETITVGELRELLAKQQAEQKALAAANGSDADDADGY